MKNFESIHTPVLVETVQTLLVTKPGGRYLDGTLGLGGHAAGILGRAGPDAQLLGLDRDARALELAGERLAAFAGAVHFRHCAFADFAEELRELEWDLLDGALLDLGVSSLQLDTPERGFSFLRSGLLDMRMDTRQSEDAAALVNRAPVRRLAEIIGAYGEDPLAGRIAKAIDEARAKAPVESTAQLAAIVEKAYPPKWRATARNHPATRTFQALRMVVNDELGQLKSFLERIVPSLAQGGRIVIISFHSLEDRMVKHFFKIAATGCLCPPGLSICACGHEASLRLITKKPLEPPPEEKERNPRAGSARLRAAERTGNNFSLPAGADAQVWAGQAGRHAPHTPQKTRRFRS
jgi:16S rRNA (cytosine1402-N4)-methyltransferase